MNDVPCGLSDFLSPGDACWRDFLPNLYGYYVKRVPKLAQAASNVPWALGLCPFHGNYNADAMLMVDLIRGEWRCSAQCGSGDMVEFHMRMYGMNFDTAVRELILLREGPEGMCP